VKFRVAQVTTIVLFALVMGVFWGTWFSLSRTMNQLSPETFVAVGHEMIQNLGVPMAILLPLALLSALVNSGPAVAPRSHGGVLVAADRVAPHGGRPRHHPGRRGTDRQQDQDLDGGDPAR
jgi:hypothetical protein